MKTKDKINNRINVLTLGCSKNLVDSENIMTQLAASNKNVSHESNEQCGTVVINTCGFIDKAKEESVNTILEYAELKKKGEIDRLIVTGCLSERYADDLKVEMPEVDAFFGTHDMPDLLEYLNAEYKHNLIGERLTTTPEHYAYLKISEGCNRTCSFCAIPLMRGKHVSRTIEDLKGEARNLVASGVKEVILIAQELTYYGLDIYKKRALGDLLDALCEVEGLHWIRLHYAYPSKFPMEILTSIKNQNKVCNYLDLPLQHANDAVLARMKRQITQAETTNLIQEIRKQIPNVCLRTTMLVGFPGETEEEFQDLMDFVKEHRFDRLGVFMYSHEEDTSAYEMEDDVPAGVKADRYNRLMELQSEISFDHNLKKIGQSYQVLIDRKEGDMFVGRTYSDSPEVDNEVLIPASEDYCRVGDFVKVEIVNAEEYDLYAKVVKESN